MPDIPVKLAANDAWEAVALSGGEVAIGPSAGIAVSGDYLSDNWDDNSITNSPNTRTGFSENIFQHPGSNEAGDTIIGADRPNWITSSGSPSAAGGELQLADGSTTAQIAFITSIFTIGSWQFDFQYNGDPTSGQSELTFIANSTSISAAHFQNSYLVHIGNGGGYDVREDTSGSVTSIINSTWGSGGTGDTSQHTSTVDRDSEGSFEIFEDGSSEGTATDTTRRDSLYLAIGNTTNQQIDIDNLAVS